MSPVTPLFQHADTQVIAWYNNQPVSAKRFLSQVLHTARTLPATSYVINICDNRYRFMVGFAAAIVNRQVTLLPSSGITGAVHELASNYPDSVCLTDRSLDPADLPRCQVTAVPDTYPPAKFVVPEVNVERLVAILFTSGSTGTPSANEKYWGDLQFGTALADQRFGFQAQQIKGLVATVPPQHMYGLEISILIPWFSRLAVHAGRPLFPADVCHALSTMQSPGVLITTPIHLRACLLAGLEWPEVAFIISATAPLSKQLAAEAEAVFGAPVYEIYGCTEAGSVASRRTVETPAWQLYDGMQLTQTETGYLISGPQLPQAIPLSDQLKLLDKPFFELLGRQADMLKIAGKRASLGDLNHKLNAIEGVDDGVIFLPEQQKGEAVRLAALVVAPELSKQTLQKKLGQIFDPAFMPRPLYLVEQLPRNTSGKLPRQRLLHLLTKLQDRRAHARTGQ
jgi:acyl-coenzyme A synthetase/AMP-(fatty) acid ligase